MLHTYTCMQHDTIPEYNVSTPYTVIFILLCMQKGKTKEMLQQTWPELELPKNGVP